MNTTKGERGIVILALFVLIIIGALVAAMLFVMQHERDTNGQGTQIKFESTINL